MEPEIKIFPSPVSLAEEFASEFAGMVSDSAIRNETFTVALSGGSTPELLYDFLGRRFAEKIDWEQVHLFWGDERCVPPADSESNYGKAYEKMLGKLSIPSSGIHRIKGEDDPVKEAARYSDEISAWTINRNGIPSFNLVLLGLGEDGHTASIFPGQRELLISEKICEPAVHPLTQQKRITITGKVINNADKVVFLVTGRKKAVIVADILKRIPAAQNYPAAYIVPEHGRLQWFLDEEAAVLINK